MKPIKSLKDKASRLKLKFEDEKVNVCYIKDIEQAVLEKKSLLQTRINYLKQLESKRTYSKLEVIEMLKYELQENKDIYGDWEK